MKNVIIISFIFIFSLFFISNVKAADFVPEFYEIRGGSYSGTLMASSENNARNIYICQNNSYCIMTLSFFFDTDINYNGQQILTTLDVCSGVDNFPRYYDSSNTGTVSNGYLVSYETVGSCTLYGQSVLRQRLKIAWTPSYNTVDGYTNTYLNSLWSSRNDIGSEVAFQILSVNNEIYTSEMQAQDKENEKNQEIINQQQQTNDKLDDITNMDIPDSSKEGLDDSSYQDYQGAEDDLMDSVGEADLSSVDIAIDGDSSNFIWDTITDIFQSHPLIMSTVIAILSIGIIKLALGR